MGSGWFKTIIRRKTTMKDGSKKVKESTTEQSNGFKWRNRSQNYSTKLYKGNSSGNPGIQEMSVEVAAIRIQTAFRGYKACNTLRTLKGIERLSIFAQSHHAKQQVATTLGYNQAWNRIQTQISARHLCMVTEGRVRQRKHNSQLKLDVKVHDIEAEWCGGSDTIEESLARIQQREEAAVKRERAMAYAFSHQWRANSGHHQGQFVNEFGKGIWGWRWMDRWITALPCQRRLSTQSTSPVKVHDKASIKVNTNSSVWRVSSPVKPEVLNGKGSTKI